MKQQVIVTANYHHRKGPLPWLVRAVGTKPEQAIPVASVTVINGRFQRSTTYEQGFGCSMVLVGEIAPRQHGPQLSSGHTGRLEFDGYQHFYLNGVQTTACRVDSARAISLGEDRSILADLRKG